MDIKGNLDIEGPGAGTLTIDGNNASIVFKVSSGATASIAGLTIAHGFARAGGGGGIDNSGTLMVANCTLSNDFGQIGGAVLNRGTMTVVNSVLSHNKGTFLGGAIENLQTGTMTVTGSTLTHNSSIEGGGIDDNGALTLKGSTLSANSAEIRGSGLATGPTATVTLVGDYFLGEIEGRRPHTRDRRVFSKHFASKTSPRTRLHGSFRRWRS